MCGQVFASRRPSSWYRVVPISEVSLEWRHQLDASRRPACQIAGHCRHVWQQIISGVPQVVIAYETDGEFRSLLDVMHHGSPSDRVAGLAALLRNLPEICGATAPPLWLMPADVLVGPNGVVRWLWIPRPPLPDAPAVLQERTRVFHLAPEFIRSDADLEWNKATWDDFDRYALGGTALRVFFNMPANWSVGQDLFRGAGGTLFGNLSLRKDLPPWLDKFSDFRNTLALLKRLVAPAPKLRRNVDLHALANRLDTVQRLLDPRHAVRWLRDQSEPKAALDLLQEVFLRAESLSLDADVQYDLLCMAGELCGSYLRRSLEAIDYYERAIVLKPGERRAYREQLHTIANAHHHSDFVALLEMHRAIATEFDVRLWRDYRQLAGNRVAHAEHADDEADDKLVVAYLLRRQQYDLARDFIYPRLFDSQGTYLWWDFDLGIAYVRSFLGLESGDGANVENASRQLQQVKDALVHVGQQLSLEPFVASQYGEQIAELEFRIYQIRHRNT